MSLSLAPRKVKLPLDYFQSVAGACAACCGGTVPRRCCAGKLNCGWSMCIEIATIAVVCCMRAGAVPVPPLGGVKAALQGAPMTAKFVDGEITQTQTA